MKDKWAPGTKHKHINMQTVPVGTPFYVTNGNWEGEIVEQDGVKHVKFLGAAKDYRMVSLAKPHTLDIRILDAKGGRDV